MEDKLIKWTGSGNPDGSVDIGGPHEAIARLRELIAGNRPVRTDVRAPEETAETQKVVTKLIAAANAVEMFASNQSPLVHAIWAAIERFKKMDPKVEI